MTSTPQSPAGLLDTEQADGLVLRAALLGSRDLIAAALERTAARPAQRAAMHIVLASIDAALALEVDRCPRGDEPAVRQAAGPAPRNAAPALDRPLTGRPGMRLVAD